MSSDNITFLYPYSQLLFAPPLTGAILTEENKGSSYIGLQGKSDVVDLSVYECSASDADRMYDRAR